MESQKDKMRSAFEDFLNYVTEFSTGDIIIPKSSASVLIGDIVVEFSLRREANLDDLRGRVLRVLSWHKQPATLSVVSNKSRIPFGDVEMTIENLVMSGDVVSVITDRKYRGEHVVKYQLANGSE